MTLQLPLEARPSTARAPLAAAAGLDPAKPLIAAMLVLSLVLFGGASVPAEVVPWRPVARFVHHRNLDLILIGVVLVAAAAVTILLTRGS